MTPDYVLHDISHRNLLLYGASIPSLDTDKEKGAKDELNWGGPMDWSNPDNFNDTTNNRVKV